MKISQESLNKWVSIATIASLVAVPTILAVVGYLAQEKISTDGLKRDYVQIAIGILKEGKSKEREDRELREWAVSILDKHAPVRFSKGTRESLEQGVFVFPKNMGEIPPYKGLKDGGALREFIEALKDSARKPGDSKDK